jgi:predicted RNA-binding protein with PUA-like domain
MAKWLLKTEPSSWSWDQQVAAGPQGTPWTGVRNHAAKAHLAAMKVGECAFFYHSGAGKAIVGVVEVSAPYRTDPTDPTGKFGLVDVRAIGPFVTPVTLEAVKAEPRLAEMVLVKNSRLSVQPVTPAEWSLICRMGGVADDGGAGT